MDADQWLKDLNVEAEAAFQGRQRENSQANDLHESTSLSDSSSCSQSETEMSSVDDDDNLPVHGPVNICDCGPTIEEHRAHVARGLDHLHSTSTRDQCARKFQEYKEFAREVMKNEEITVEGALKFLQFQAHREIRVTKETPEEALEREAAGQKRKRKSKRMKKTNNTKAAKCNFKIEDCIQVMDHIQKDVVGVEPENWVKKNRLGSVAKHHQALLRHCSDEVRVAIRANQAAKTLVDNVHRRTKMAKVEFDDDCLDKIAEKFECPELCKLSEGHFWDENKSKADWKNLTTSLRNRHTFLMSVQTCTRHEATLSCMLQAFDVAEIPLSDELEPHKLLTRNICKGKINQGDSATTIQAKSMRHRDPKFCEQGALAMCLFARFRIHDEEFDLSDNCNWLKVRTTVAVDNNARQFDKSRFKCMTAGTHCDKLAIMFQHFGHNISHVMHFGRSCAPVLLEFAEVMTALIEQLGNWRHTVCDKWCSLNLPWEALRAAAGFRKEKGFCRLARNKVPVPAELRKSVFPNVERARQKFELLSTEEQCCLPVATEFLAVMDHSAEVFVQDICQMRCEGRDSHQLHTDPFFEDPRFLQCEESFKESFRCHSDPADDPALDPVRKAAPLMGHHLGDLKVITHQGFQSSGSQVTALNSQNETLCAAMVNQTQLTEHICHVIGSAATAAHAAHTHAPSPVAAALAAPTTSPCMPATTSPSVTTATAEPMEPTAPEHPTRNEEGPLFPEFDRLCHESIEQTCNDWFGEGDSPCTSHGGIKTLCDNKAWRKSSGKVPGKREADKKMLQKMKRTGGCIECAMDSGKTKEEVASQLREMTAKSPKSKEALAGIDALLKNEFAEKQQVCTCNMCHLKDQVMNLQKVHIEWTATISLHSSKLSPQAGVFVV